MSEVKNALVVESTFLDSVKNYYTNRTFIPSVCFGLSNRATGQRLHLAITLFRNDTLNKMNYSERRLMLLAQDSKDVAELTEAALRGVEKFINNILPEATVTLLAESFLERVINDMLKYDGTALMVTVSEDTFAISSELTTFFLAEESKFNFTPKPNATSAGFTLQ